MSDSLEIPDIISALKSVIKRDEAPLHEPMFAGMEWEYVKDCLDTGWVSSAGKYVDEFEDRIERFTGIKHAIATANGTASLHLCLRLAGVGQGDEVLVPALTFIATANAVSYCGAIPHFIDIDERTLGADAEKMERYLDGTTVIKNGICFNHQTGRPIRAAVIMHTFGHPADLDPLVRICKKFCLALIEDAAEALGSLYKNQHVGSFGRISSLSFNGNKIVTTGGGGAVLTNDPDLAKTAKHLSTTAKLPHPWAFIHDQIGYNYRLPNINAALGCAQMEQINDFIRYKRNLAERYRDAFRGMKGITLFHEMEYARSNYWLNVLILEEGCEAMRDPVLAATNEMSIKTRPVWTLMNKLAMYRSCPRMDLSTSESLEQRMINIPSSAGLGADYGG